MQQTARVLSASGIRHSTPTIHQHLASVTDLHLQSLTSHHQSLSPMSMAAPDRSLPVIDISPFLHSTPPSPSTHPTTQSLRSALRTHGFFYLSHHAISTTLTSRVLSLARTFFTEASPARKEFLKRRDAGEGLGDGGRGYQRMGENITDHHRDWHEALDWYAPMRDGEGVDEDHMKLGHTGTSGADRQPPFNMLEGVNLWPTQPAGFRDAYEEYARECRRVGDVVLRIMGYAMGLEDPDFFLRAARDSFWVMRAVGYPPLDEQVAKTGGLSCGEHTDYGFLTLLLEDGTPDALQVWLKDEHGGGGRWEYAQPLPGTLVVNVGDMVEKWTGGEIRSTRHRVVHRSNSFRVSIPFFFEPGREVHVQVLKEFEEAAERRIERGEIERDALRAVKYGDFLYEKVLGTFYGEST